MTSEHQKEKKKINLFQKKIHITVNMYTVKKIKIQNNEVQNNDKKKTNKYI